MASTRELRRDDVVTDAATLLRLAREQRLIADRADAELLALALEWAHLHPGFGVITEQDWEELGGERSLPLAGPGTPDVAEFSVPVRANQSGPSVTIDGTGAVDATWLITVGQEYSPSTAGNGGLSRG